MDRKGCQYYPNRFQQVSYSQLQIQPESPQAGNTITLNYQPQAADMQKAAKLIGTVYINGSKMTAIDVPMKKNKTGWTGSFTLPDSASAFIVKMVNGEAFDTNEKKGYAFFVADSNGEPLKTAYRFMSHVYDGMGTRMGIDPDEKKSSYYFNKYYESGLSKDAPFEEALSYYQTKKDTAAVIDLLAGLGSDPNVSDRDLSSASFYADQYGNKALGKMLVAYHKLKFPEGSWKTRELYPIFNAAKTAASKQAVLDSFKATLKEPVQEWQERVINNINSNIANLLGREGKFKEAVTLAENSRKGTDLAATLNSIAWNGAEKGTQLDEVAAISKQSLDIIEKEKKEMLYKDPAISPSEYGSRLREMEGMFSDTYAYILYQQGNYNDGFAQMQRSIDIVGTKSSEYNERYALLLEKVKGGAKAIKFLESAVEDGAYSSGMKKQLETLYAGARKKQPFDEYFSALTQKMKEKKLKELRASILNEPAPDFSLYNLEGKEVSLASLKGKVVVVDFWATWCGPCIASFPAMYTAQQQHASKADVVFLFVNTWEQSPDKKKNVQDFFTGKPYSFPVQALDTEDKMVSSFKVEGIPTKFVLDKNGNIRFKSVGYGGNESQTVDEISAMIQIAGEQSGN